MTSTPVATILKSHNSGNFTVSGCIKLLGEPVKPEHATKMVREAEITDPLEVLIYQCGIVTSST